MFLGDTKVPFIWYYSAMKNNKQSAVRKVGADRDFLAPDRRFYYLWCYGAVVTCNDRSRFEVQNRFSIIKSNESGNGHGFPGFLNQITRHCKDESFDIQGNAVNTFCKC